MRPDEQHNRRNGGTGAARAAAARAALPGLKAARRMTTATVIYERLYQSIVSLGLPPGTPLQEKLLAEQFGVSRTPVREAVIRLSEAGLVDIYPQSGTFVSRVPVAAIPEAVMIRKALECATVEAAAEMAGEAELARLDAVLRRQRMLADLGDTSAFHDADEAFHETIAEISGHPGVWRLLKQVKVQIDRARRLTLPVLGRMEKVIGEHKTIREAIARHDRAAAAAAMRVHLSAVIPDVDQLREQYPGYFD